MIPLHIVICDTVKLLGQHQHQIDDILIGITTPGNFRRMYFIGTRANGWMNTMCKLI